MTRVVLAGGGTGGHIFPMRSVAAALLESGLAAESLVYVGSRRGQERALLGGGPIPLVTLSGRGLRRSMRASAVRENLGALVGLAVASVRAWFLFARWRPSVVVSFGGYAALPAGLAAVLWRRPLVLVDLDATPGATQRLLARFARARCVAHGASGPRDVVTGVPLREEISSLSRDDDARRRARSEFSPPITEERLVLVVMTGSLGARSVNDAVSELARLWSARSDVTILHVTGRRDVDRVRSRTPHLESLDYRTYDFADMSTIWQVADVALCRAGATTLAELCALGIPSVLVPLPGAPGDHQGQNARRLADAGAAVVLEDRAMTGERLAAALDGLIANGRYLEVGRAARDLARPDAARAIGDVVRRVGGFA
ncbi:MAG TPA: UDP-N-acetylglucosamine--N-acetylmuramyl-(pentapeptide) pyrophosphoryl-undecaprenol N-acetylglucosamine transferase [Acidimicrobiales bacterium]|nr:UDP-N-acetylglucosamine--N-acetylmuramyl-(pentapeptide) pyrophosphoryl-undecaprenol N-acetylglucosamine transferase [Acidimicrobiales bacterium]